MSGFRDSRGSEQFSCNQIGHAASVKLESDYLSRPSLVSHSEAFPKASATLHWGDCLRPRHFTFEHATHVHPRLTTLSDVPCYAVSIPGAGRFKENDAAQAVEFENGGIIVNRGARYKFFTLEAFQKHFVLANGETVHSLYQIDFQTPKI